MFRIVVYSQKENKEAAFWLTLFILINRLGGKNAHKKKKSMLWWFLSILLLLLVSKVYLIEGILGKNLQISLKMFQAGIVTGKLCNTYALK